MTDEIVLETSSSPPESGTPARSGVAGRMARLLEYPGARELSIDSPETTLQRVELIRRKTFLRRIYDEWYRLIAGAIPSTGKPTLEIGSGAGFMSEYVDDLVTSDILELPNVSRVLDASVRLPFEDRSLRAIAMVNTLHHLPDIQVFLAEAVRCLEPGGVMTAIEPWNTPWSRFVWGYLHHEPFDPHSASWRFDSTGPLSSANGALPWIVFARDADRLGRLFPELAITSIQPIMPLRYLLSGGVSMRALVPDLSFAPLRFLEHTCRPLTRTAAMFAHINVTRY